MAQMALAWVYSREGITSVLIGASKPEQILENLKMTEQLHFSRGELDEIDRIALSWRILLSHREIHASAKAVLGNLKESSSQRER